MDLSKINAISVLPPFLPTTKLSDLTIGNEYQITNVKKVNTKYGARVIATVGKEFNIFLPKRTSAAIIEDPQQFEQLTNAISNNNIYFLYHGGQYHDIEIIFRA
ncbi:Protein of unknown function [Cotesia congregata]|uniref:Uncharacterized protein n=1 Tax=Cotesia congregata TaxID=51543 RepID=A0A8J2MSL9_COTCN|nr:Protein of unknown function [Cotesia congregata]